MAAMKQKEARTKQQLRSGKKEPAARNNKQAVAAAAKQL